MAAGPFEGDAVTTAADAGVRDRGLVAAVDRDELLDPVFVLALLKQVLHAAKVSLPFLADVADEEDVARRPESCRSHGADQRQQQRHAARVVADAGRIQPIAHPLHFYVGAFREDCVDVRKNRNNATLF